MRRVRGFSYLAAAAIPLYVAAFTTTMGVLRPIGGIRRRPWADPSPAGRRVCVRPLSGAARRVWSPPMA